jgi:hypothetical protein
MEEENNNSRAGELLTNWSKWLISINVFAATGCIVGLKTAGEAVVKTGVYFFMAILFFGLSVVCATLFVFLMAKKAFDKNETSPPKYMWLANLQWFFFMLGLMFVLIWIGFLSKIF